MEVSNLQVKYGKDIIVENLSFHVKEKEIIGIIGKNGVGKTTLLNTVAGLKEFSKGYISLLSDETNIGFCPESSDVYDYLTGREFLEVLSDLKKFPQKELEELKTWISYYINMPDLEVPLSILSKGNLEKVIFIQSFINYPKILILDEPFSGFDTMSFIGAKKLLLEYSKRGNSIILSTHIIEMCAQICDKVIILNNKNDIDIIVLNNKNNLETKIKLLESKIQKWST